MISSPIPRTVCLPSGSTWFRNPLMHAINEAVAVPPRYPNRSTSVVLAPLRAAAIAAVSPAGPPPATTTSASRATGISRAGSR